MRSWSGEWRFKWKDTESAIDARVIETGKERNIDVSGLCMLREGELGYIVAVNKKPSEDLLKYKLQDEIDIVFGFCGG